MMTERDNHCLRQCTKRLTVKPKYAPGTYRKNEDLSLQLYLLTMYTVSQHSSSPPGPLDVQVVGVVMDGVDER